MLQMKAQQEQVKTTDDDDENVVEYKSEERANSLLHYFKWWAAGEVEQRLPLIQASLMQVDASKSMATAKSVAGLISQTHAEICPNHEKPHDVAGWQVHSRSDDESGVQHVVMRSPEGKLQYVAAHSNAVLAADPAVCAGRDLSLAQEEQQWTPRDAGVDEALNIYVDPLVKDCVKLFHRTAKQRCGQDFEVKVLSAMVHVIDGFSVQTNMQLKDSSGKVTFHDPECDFEVPYSQDAELLQTGADEDEGSSARRRRRRRAAPEKTTTTAAPKDEGGDQLQEEKDGLEATLRMHVDICSAPESDTVPDTYVPILAQFGLGHLPYYKGFEWMNADYEKIPIGTTFAQIEQVPGEYSMVKKYPSCFPKNGQEVVRNQGACGSCWAFASASALMANLCKSANGGAHALAGASDRYEVSIQHIMSCSGSGCMGGSFMSAQRPLSTGVVRERDFRYRCGGGRSEDHFDTPSVNCKSSNGWGASCPSRTLHNSAWSFTGLQRIPIGRDNEQNMQKNGYGLWCWLHQLQNLLELHELPWWRLQQCFWEHARRPCNDTFGIWY
jgi:hypothetical protein